MKPKELKKIIDNPKGRLFAFDLDGTLSVGPYWGKEYSERPEPNPKTIALCEKIVRGGGYVVIYTVRPPAWAKDTIAWLIEHGVWYHGINFGQKPGAAVYIDDRAVNVNDII